MTKLYVACMRWACDTEPVCAGTNKLAVIQEALRILKAEHGKGLVDRGAAMCSARIQRDDIEVIEIPFIQTRK